MRLCYGDVNNLDGMMSKKNGKVKKQDGFAHKQQNTLKERQ